MRFRHFIDESMLTHNKREQTDLQKATPFVGR